MTEQEIIDRIKQKVPFEGISDVRLVNVIIGTGQFENFEADVTLMLSFGEKLINVFGEIKTQITPKGLMLLGEKLSAVKMSNKENQIYALICPFLSPESQKYCQEKNINFIDLSGNILLRIPGQLLIQRLGKPNLYKAPQLFRNPFFGGSSRVLRVLLKSPKRRWTVTEIEAELIQESQKQNTKDAFKLSISSISKTIRSLEEKLLIRRDNLAILVPEPRYLLSLWAEKYRERYASIKRSSWTGNNPFALDIELSIKGLKMLFSDLDYLVTGTAAANLIAPFVDTDRIDVFIQRNQADLIQRRFVNEQSIGPNFLFIVPDDKGVSMYTQDIKGLKIVSPIQAYLDCYARGGRDAKQAEYLLNNIIEKEWKLFQ